MTKWPGSSWFSSQSWRIQWIWVNLWWLSLTSNPSNSLILDSLPSKNNNSYNISDISKTKCYNHSIFILRTFFILFTFSLQKYILNLVFKRCTIIISISHISWLILLIYWAEMQGKRILWSRAVECDKTGEMTTCVWSMISILSCNNGRTFWHDYKSSNISSMSKVRSSDYSQSFVNVRCL
jgi:hypothetical protein